MGDERVEELCRRISPRLVGSLVLQGESREVAEDLAQEALARAWERWPAVSRMDSPDGWVFRVAFNLASSHRRRAGAERRATARLGTARAAVGDQAGPDGAAATDDRLVLQAALDALPPRQRQAVVLRHYAQLSVAEASLAMGCAPGTVKALTSQGIASLRRTVPDVTTPAEPDDVPGGSGRARPSERSTPSTSGPEAGRSERSERADRSRDGDRVRRRGGARDRPEDPPGERTNERVDDRSPATDDTNRTDPSPEVAPDA